MNEAEEERAADDDNRADEQHGWVAPVAVTLRFCTCQKENSTAGVSFLQGSAWAVGSTASTEPLPTLEAETERWRAAGWR